MHILGWIVFGLVVGIVAKFLMPGRDPGGFVITAILGIVGALVGGFVGRSIGWYGEGDPVGFVMAVIGSIIVLALYRVTWGRTATV
ncbi:MAG TPA: GlsB/YeaQ/YmgE family stress response membrane protein [Candidatus Rokubacteria bacterium]|nr:MAG: transglycosylase [Candidatus Rokubacteria bacterium RIFCSPLOWO2_12_FULL_71_19]HAM58228.1 GlsB/YeaQ/YmgE family stress response membrane protein [Candidatus Rokubacteria bacterium]